jgi:hypothetical protein
MMKKQLLITFIALTTIFQAFSQSAERRLGFEVSGGINDYQGDLGTSFFLQRKPEHQGIGIAIGYYLNPHIDVCLFGSGGDVGYTAVVPNVPPEQTNTYFRANVAAVNGGIRYKIIKDKAFTPYLMMGAGIA